MDSLSRKFNFTKKFWKFENFLKIKNLKISRNGKKRLLIWILINNKMFNSIRCT